jgi:glycosidase
MDASQVASYNAQALVGTSSTTAASNFNSAHPLYQAIAALAQLRQQHPALRHGRQVVRTAGRTPGLFAVSRLDAATGQEVLVAFNTGTTPVESQVVVERSSRQFTALHGRCAPSSSQPGSYHVALVPLDYVICMAGTPP